MIILPVIFFHAGFNSFDHGYLGVDIFFVISGYLIGSSIQRLKNKKLSSLGFFYSRRILRLFPALIVVTPV